MYINKKLNWYGIFKNESKTRIIFELIAYMNLKKNRKYIPDHVLCLMINNKIQDYEKNLQYLIDNKYIESEKKKTIIYKNLYMGYIESIEENYYKLSYLGKKLINDKYDIN